MSNLRSEETIKELTKLPSVRLLLKHAVVGIVTTSIGLGLLLGILILNSVNPTIFSDYVWSALFSVPITLIVTGIFSTFYEWYIRTTFVNSMRSLYWAWDTGVTVFPTHKHAPNRREVLSRSHQEVRLMSTTLSRYFLDTSDLVEEKLNQGVKFKFILYDPDSEAIKEKAREENISVRDFVSEIESTWSRYLQPWTIKYPGRIQVRFCDFNTPFGITIVDDREMVLSLNIYGLARSKNQTPCLIIQNKFDPDSVFKLYENSFEAIWNKLEDTPIPTSLYQPNEA